MPWLGDVKPVGQEGTFTERAKDIAGEALKVTSTVLPVGGGAVGVGRATLAGKIGRGALVGARSGAVGGGLYGLGEGLQQKDATIGGTVGSTALGATTGLLTGAALGTALPAIPAVTKSIARISSKSGRTNYGIKLMNQIARVDPNDYKKFKQMTGEDVGEYLVKRGKIKTREELIADLFAESQRSKQVADDAFASIKGNFKNIGSVTDTLDELLQHEMRISTPNVPSRNIGKVESLIAKYNSDGLNMTEVNEIKRMLERRKIDYLKQNVPESVDKMKTLDSSLREWQLEEAKLRGLQNLQEINKNTQAAYTLADALYKKSLKQSGKNELSLTDAVLLAGGDVTNALMFGARRLLSSENLKPAVVKMLLGKQSVLPQVSAKMGQNKILQLPAPSIGGYRSSISASGKPIIVAPSNSNILVPFSTQVGGETPMMIPKKPMR